MNNIFRDLINERDVLIFIDDVLVETETKKKYDKLIKEILKRLEKNNLYVKPKKYM